MKDLPKLRRLIQSAEDIATRHMKKAGDRPQRLTDRPLARAGATEEKNRPVPLRHNGIFYLSKWVRPSF